MIVFQDKNDLSIQLGGLKLLLISVILVDIMPGRDVELMACVTGRRGACSSWAPGSASGVSRGQYLPSSLFGIACRSCGIGRCSLSSPCYC